MIGLNSHDMEPHTREILRSLGVRRVRTTLYWDRWESDLAYRDHRTQMLQAAVAEGFELLIAVHGCPPYADAGDYAEVMAEMARAIPADWQLGNEAPVWPCSGADWARAHRDAYHAIQDASPGSRVVTLGFGWSHIADEWARDFFREAPPFDVLAIHVYHSLLVEALEDAVGMAPTLHPIWVTEFGTDENEARQLQQWTQLVERNDTLQWAERLYGYALRTDHAGLYGKQEFHGILRPDGTLKPAAEYVRAYNAGGAQ